MSIKINKKAFRQSTLEKTRTQKSTIAQFHNDEMYKYRATSNRYFKNRLNSKSNRLPRQIKKS